MLRNREIPDEDFAPVLSMLFNINLLDPRYARYIVSYLEQSKSAMGVQRLAEIINRELDRSLQDGYDQEVLNLLFFLRAINLEIEGSLLLGALDMENDFIDVIALDFWTNRNDLVNKSSNEAHEIDRAVGKIADELRRETVDGEHWLLIYEAKAHSLLDIGEFSGKTADFFAAMLDQGVSFYCPELK